jgi:hypothetical protein
MREARQKGTCTWDGCIEVWMIFQTKPAGLLTAGCRLLRRMSLSEHTSTKYIRKNTNVRRVDEFLLGRVTSLSIYYTAEDAEECGNAILAGPSTFHTTI